jgi:hypothetical protein
LKQRLLAVVCAVSVLAPTLGLALAGESTTAFAYQACNSTSSATVSATSADPNQPIDFTATFKDCNGGAQSGVPVTFHQESGPAGCTASFNPPTAVTDTDGVARTVVTLPAGCPCQYTIAATGAGITLTAVVREIGCLPFTAGGSAASVAVHPAPVPALALAVLALALGLLATSIYLVRKAA